GKWKVSRSCVCYLEERRLYHRKDGEVVKLRDDVLSAARYGMMMRRHFKPLDECDPGHVGTPWPRTPGMPGRRGPPRFARGAPGHSTGEMNPFTGKVDG